MRAPPAPHARTYEALYTLLDARPEWYVQYSPPAGHLPPYTTRRSAPKRTSIGIDSLDRPAGGAGGTCAAPHMRYCRRTTARTAKIPPARPSLPARDPSGGPVRHGSHSSVRAVQPRHAGQLLLLLRAVLARIPVVTAGAARARPSRAGRRCSGHVRPPRPRFPAHVRRMRAPDPWILDPSVAAVRGAVPGALAGDGKSR
jgi:hypothetical protein